MAQNDDIFPAKLAALSEENLFNVKGLVAVVTGGCAGGFGPNVGSLVANSASKLYILGRRLQLLQDTAAQFDSNNVVPVTEGVTFKESLQSAANKVQQGANIVTLLVCSSDIGGSDGNRPKPDPSLNQFVEGNLSVLFQDHADTFGSVWYMAIFFLKLLVAGNTKGNVEQQSQIVTVSAVGKFGKFAYGQSNLPHFRPQESCHGQY
ncbi:hypothetical protein GGR53DRAFT_467439 [Hypoxylon sp. FL1150]|nr:hypothetical protein GGR53DRAFT_467439 [Hypoxylon sp. FL1150]